MLEKSLEHIDADDIQSLILNDVLEHRTLEYKVDRSNEQLVLVSESTRDLPSIHIHPDEMNYFVCGKVVRVIKKPRV